MVALLAIIALCQGCAGSVYPLSPPLRSLQWIVRYRIVSTYVVSNLFDTLTGIGLERF